MSSYLRSFPGTLGASLVLCMIAPSVFAQQASGSVQPSLAPAESSMISDLPSAPGAPVAGNPQQNRANSPDTPAEDGSGDDPSSVATNPNPARIGGTVTASRSEERRVGKECRARWAA